MKYVLILFAVISLSYKTCNTKSQDTSYSKEVKHTQIQNKKFLLTTLNKKDISEAKLHITFNTEDNLVSGFAGCNNFSCKYTLKDENISFEYPMFSKMYCKKYDTLEKDILKTLKAIKTRVYKQDSLFLKDSTGAIVIAGIQSKD